MQLLMVWIGVAAAMAIAWVYYKFTGIPSIVDVFWGAVICFVGLYYLHAIIWTERYYWMASLLLIWAIRLSGYLWYTRVRVGEIDKRYVRLSEGWKSSDDLGYFFNYQLQALLIVFITMPFFILNHWPHPTMHWPHFVGVAITVIGIIGETIADKQLYEHRRDNQGAVCDRGLWTYSRHPNYFFEWLVWIGFSLMVIHNLFSLIALMAPMTVFSIVYGITGPMTERGSLESRGDAFRAYQKKTSYFIPWWPKPD